MMQVIKNLKLNFLLLIFFASCAIAQKSTKNETFSNPILKGMNPDPSICRVGDDYYMVTSSFGFFPGLPIYHSKDLVNWKLIGHGIDSASQLKLKEKESLNLYAATIRYHNGTFYIINTNTGQSSRPDRNFVITATNPAGSWSQAHFIKGADRIDPSLFFDDDGKIYYSGNTIPDSITFDKEKNIWTQEIDPKTWQLVGKRVDVVKSATYWKKLSPTEKEQKYLTFFEGPHLYKKDGTYYMLISHGGTDWNHAVSIFKSKNVFGPFEYCPNNPIITHRDLPHTHPLVHTGHADLVQTQNNQWWMVLLTSRPYGGAFTNMGRETSLVPVDWSGEWPIVNPKEAPGRVLTNQKKPDLKNHPWKKEPARDNFDTPKLNLNWNFMQIPASNWWSLDDVKGSLKINLRKEIIQGGVNPSFIGRRQTDKSFTASTKMDFTPKLENETAGMVISRDAGNQFQFMYGLKNGKKIISLIKKDVIEQTLDTIAQKEMDVKTIYLKMEAEEQSFTFSFSGDGKNWRKMADKQNGSFLSNALGTGRFTGTFIGMYASSTGKESNNYTLFDWFEYSGF
ncbi:glycoside hydrolase family 43 protein [Pedobacter sp. SD-b]|uniref:Glycoside hydrolase family 43 protein n=1 Tax=Pedobacter segetis TaxID=2793069 RepID=A0ABS1BL31_9SPHI|nr:glycoside hydrolase family 43 protein [Pedobacter segetis]MBK0383600.1 glycoside hydrolase family 43 protein [Pedobacter segetis]